MRWRWGGGGGGGGGDGYLNDIIPESLFEEMLPHSNANNCHAIGLYTYDAFISAAKEFPEFGNFGNIYITILMIIQVEYDYCVRVQYQLGFRFIGFRVCKISNIIRTLQY
jgi:hypothetical protein